jgi:uncharacterized protein (DUF4415 family)
MTVKERDTARHSRKPTKTRPGRTNLRRVRSTTNAEIEADAMRDPDVAPLLDDAWFAKARAVVPLQKIAISIRVDPDVIEFFRKTGPGYQTRMNAILRAFMERARRK